MAETLDRALLFLEERSGTAYGESPPKTRADFEQAAWDLGQALDKEYPAFRAAEAQAVSRFLGFFSMTPEGTPWTTAAQHEKAKALALRSMRALLGRLPKGSADTQAAQKWLDFYGREEKQARARAEQIRARIEESEKTPEQAGMIVTPAGDVIPREAVRRFASGAAVAPALGEPRSLPFRRPPPRR
ncbi:MAG: hypothetical protein HY720_15475 [Planctomycetes bacterium]|nr:hypothetical protein [Planctomycetota bacterium]